MKQSQAGCTSYPPNAQVNYYQPHRLPMTSQINQQMNAWPKLTINNIFILLQRF